MSRSRIAVCHASNVVARLGAPLAGMMLTLALAGCAALPRPRPDDAPLPPLALGLPAETGPQMQTLSVAFGDRQITLSCGQSTTADRWRSVCINPLGLRVFTLGLGADGQLTAERGDGVPEALDARRVLADVQLASWPLAALEAACAGSRWRVEQVAVDTRRLWLDGRLHSEVHYASPAALARGPHWLVNLAQRYTLAIRPEAGTALTP